MPFKSHNLAENSQHKKHQDEILTINLALKIMSNKRNGIAIEGFQDEMDMASIFAKARNLYKKALQNWYKSTGKLWNYARWHVCMLDHQRKIIFARAFCVRLCVCVDSI